MFTVSKEFHFSAMHWLPDHDGQCRNRHGHNYKVEIGFSRPSVQVIGPKAGMVIDFGDITKWWKSELEPLLDHNDAGLNGVLPDEYLPSTAENLAAWIFLHGATSAALPLPVSFVRVYETPTAYAEYAE